MHPELEDFLETALARVPASNPAIGRAVVEPDYDAEPEPGDAAPLAEELTRLVGSREEPGEIRIDDAYPLLRKYLRRVTLHEDKIDGPWVEVAPPGNWI